MKIQRIDFFWLKLLIAVLVAVNCLLFYLSSNNYSLFIIIGIPLLVYFFIKNSIKVFEWVQFYTILVSIGGLIGLIIEIFHSPIIENFTLFGLIMSSTVITFVLSTYILKQYVKISIARALTN